LLVVCSADHPLAKKNILTWEEARAYPFIFREPGSSTRHVFERWLVQNNLPNPSGTELASTEAIKRAIAGSTNLGVLSSLAVEWEIAANHLVSLPIIGFNLERTFCLAQHKDKRPTPLLQEFKRFLLNNQRS
ncbi:MAG TPA: LysR substrate-binding domain-containing protein, partial [Desulfobacteria bacterium]|nr:LysR substrate-binding domain-containing protein [Desulfobacteria bacterium]